MPAMGQGRERLALLVLTALQMSHLLDFMVLTPLGPQLMRVFGITPTQVGLFVTVYTLSAALASLLSAFVIDRFDRKRALLWVYGGFLLSALASALAPSYALLLLARVLAGAFGGLLTGIVLAIVSDVVPEARRGRALGMVMSAFAVSSIVFLPLCLWLGSHYSWRGAYGAVLLLGALAGPLAAWLLPSVRSHMASHAAARRIGGLFGQARQVLCDANHRRALLLAGLLNASSFALVPYLSPYLVLNAGVGEAELSLVYFTGGIGSLLAVHLSGRLADRMNRYRQFLIGAALTVLITLLITQWPRSPLWATLLVSLGVFMFFPARNVPAMALITGAAQAPVRGSFMAFMAFMQHASTGLASMLAGLIVGQSDSGALTHYGWVGAMSAGITLLCMWLAGRVRRAPAAPINAAVQQS
jgi:predicted MFS family arabinose efflux permease